MNLVKAPGNGYEEGLDAGKGVAGNWKPGSTSRLENWIKAVREAPDAVRGERPVVEVLADMERLTQEDLLAHAAALHIEKMGALPDLHVFPELEGMDRYLDEQARGFAAGAEIDVREVFLARYWKEMFFYFCGGGSLAADHCSEFWFPHTPNGPLLGKGWDDVMTWYGDNPFPVPPAHPGEPPVQKIPPQDKSRGFRRSGTVNEMGLCLDNGGGASYEYEEKSDKTLFPVPVNELVLSCCATTLEAVEMLTRYNIYWGPCNLVAGDAQGMGALFEKSSSNYALRMSSRNVLITTYGGCDDEDMRRLCDSGTLLFKYYERRLRVMQEIVAAAEAGEGLDLEVYWQAILHHDPQAPGCTHLETRPEGIELFTFGAFAQLPREGRSFRRLLARAQGSLRYACDNPAVESRYCFV